MGTLSPLYCRPMSAVAAFIEAALRLTSTLERSIGKGSSRLGGRGRLFLGAKA